MSDYIHQTFLFTKSGSWGSSFLPVLVKSAFAIVAHTPEMSAEDF